MEKLATDIYSFEGLRKEGYTYVDKTAQILPLVDKSIGKSIAFRQSEDGILTINLKVSSDVADWVLKLF